MNGNHMHNGYSNGGFDIDSEKTTKLDDLGIYVNGHQKQIDDEAGSIKDEKSTETTDESNRPTWSNSIEFLMSCIATSVGLGNIWRFPFTAYENGGGAFLIPYIIVLLIIGKPMYYLEMIIGQFTSKSSVKMWSISPAFRGIGIGQLLATICVITYYCSLIALTLYYMIASFAAELPWSQCLEEWGPECVDSKPRQAFPNETNVTTENDIRAVSSSENYFLISVLNEKDDISDGIGYPSWQLTLCLLGSWVVVFFIIVRGVKSSGKASYFLALFPYVIMLALLIRAVTLEGAVNGIIFFLKPQWGELLNPKVWYAATTQMFFSLSVGMGPIIMFSSYNRFNHSIYRDAMIVTTLDTFTSLFAGITIFGILGNLAHNLGTDDIGSVVKSGTGLAFISYPDAISKFPQVPQVFSVLFFFMLFVLGIGSVVALQSVVVTVLCDQFTKMKYWRGALGACICGFLLGLIYLTPGGQWMLNLVDHFGGTLLIFVLAIFEMVVIFWIYGLESFCWDLEFMTGRRVSWYWRFCWVFLTPVFMFVVFVYSMTTLKPLTYSGLDYPDIALICGWLIFAVGMLQLPIWFVVVFVRKYFRHDINLIRTIKVLFTATSEWGPSNNSLRIDWIKFKNEALERRMKQSENHSLLRRNFNIVFGRYR